MIIGVLALQGDFREHIAVLRGLGVSAREVRKPEELVGLAGLIIPGGESTTIGKIARAYGLIEPLRELTGAGGPTSKGSFAVWGTCAGMIILAKDIGDEAPHVAVLDIKVQRNAFGRQVDSFEADLDVPALASVQSRPPSPNGGAPCPPFHAVFIRAPLIEAVGPGVDVLARLEDGTIVAARQGSLLVTSFHPELTEDRRFHEYFLSLIE
jgi:5'-phosphate synthase pdxT subunit